MESYSELSNTWKQINDWLLEDFGTDDTPTELRETYTKYDEIFEIVNEILSNLTEIESLLAKFAEDDADGKKDIATMREILSQCKKLFAARDALEEDINRIVDYRVWLEERSTEQEDDQEKPVIKQQDI